MWVSTTNAMKIVNRFSLFFSLWGVSILDCLISLVYWIFVSGLIPQNPILSPACYRRFYQNLQRKAVEVAPTVQSSAPWTMIGKHPSDMPFIFYAYVLRYKSKNYPLDSCQYTGSVKRRVWRYSDS